MKASSSSRPVALAALTLASISLIMSATGAAEALRQEVFTSKKAKPGSVVRLDRKAKIPKAVIPKVKSARNADRLGGKRANTLAEKCAPNTVDFRSWCLMNAAATLANDEVGKNDYFFATQRCLELGGFLPSAEQLIGAAPRIKLASTISDSQLTAAIDLDPTDGIRDRREMSATLVTTAAGSAAAGSIGVSEGSKGDPKQGEPDPVPLPANPAPETLQYVTVYDNGDRGGFAGSKPVSSPESFRCGFNKQQGVVSEVG